MFKRSMLVSLSLIVTLSLIIVSMPRTTRAADPTATPAPLPTATTIPPINLGSGGVHISYWNGLTGSDGSTMNDLLTAFVKEHPEVSVTMEEIPWDTLYPKLQTAFVSGTPPDVIILHSAQIPQFASYGVLMDLSSWYSDKGGFFPV